VKLKCYRAISKDTFLQLLPNDTIRSIMHILCLSRTGKANKGIERDAPDVAPLDKGVLASQIRNENFDEGSQAQ
jgi:hypothetical protein